jgi:hypothetical protein
MALVARSQKLFQEITVYLQAASKLCTWIAFERLKDLGISAAAGARLSSTSGSPPPQTGAVAGHMDPVGRRRYPARLFFDHPPRKPFWFLSAEVFALVAVPSLVLAGFMARGRYRYWKRAKKAAEAAARAAGGQSGSSVAAAAHPPPAVRLEGVAVGGVGEKEGGTGTGLGLGAGATAAMDRGAGAAPDGKPGAPRGGPGSGSPPAGGEALR